MPQLLPSFHSGPGSITLDMRSAQPTTAWAHLGCGNFHGALTRDLETGCKRQGLSLVSRRMSGNRQCRCASNTLMHVCSVVKSTGFGTRHHIKSWHWALKRQRRRPRPQDIPTVGSQSRTLTSQGDKCCDKIYKGSSQGHRPLSAPMGWT